MQVLFDLLLFLYSFRRDFRLGVLVRRPGPLDAMLPAIRGVSFRFRTNEVLPLVGVNADPRGASGGRNPDWESPGTRVAPSLQMYKHY